MFVSVVLDPGQVDSARALASILAQYGFVKKQRACWENPSVTEKKLGLLKKDIDRVTDYYDSVRFYQYPVEGMLAITELQKKKWKKCLLRPNEK
ncbi:MAG TPA: CRISPR-associated protein Cas2 [Treponemataceae bacterium]|jgi:CRISPR-associated protein Cas2|nr:CRISPR-associated protein Cas2 [Treponemataceae bacterium]